MARIVTVASRFYNSGSYTFSLPGIPTDTKGVKLTLTRESWPATLLAAVAVDLSINGGATWALDWIKYTIAGGNIMRDGVLQTETWKASTWPGEDSGTGRFEDRRVLRGTDVRATLVTNVQFRTAVTLEAI